MRRLYRPFLLLLHAGLTLVLLFVAARQFPSVPARLDAWEQAARDARLARRAPAAAHPRVRLVTVSADDLRALADTPRWRGLRWPCPPALWGELSRRLLEEGGARLVIFEVDFGPDFGGVYAPAYADTSLLCRAPGKQVLAMPWDAARGAFRRPGERLAVRAGLPAASGYQPDDDGVVRTLSLSAWDEWTVLARALAALDGRPERTRDFPDQTLDFLGPPGTVTGDALAAVLSAPDATANAPPGEAEPHAPAGDPFGGRYREALVVVGPTAELLTALVPTAVGPMTPAELQVQALSAALDGRQVRPAGGFAPGTGGDARGAGGFARGFTFWATLAAAALPSLILMFLRGRWLLPLLAAAVGGWWVAAERAIAGDWPFARTDGAVPALPIVPPLIALAASTLACAFAVALVDRRRLGRLRRLFAGRVHPAVARRLERHAEHFAWQGGAATVTVLYGRAAPADAAQHPRVSLAQRRALELAVHHARRAGGTVLALDPRAVLLVWNAPVPQPDAARRAAAAAGALLAALHAEATAGAASAPDSIRGPAAADGSPGGDLGWALAQGRAWLGVIGPPALERYVAVGPVVEAAAELAGRAAQLHAGVLAQPAVAEAAGVGFSWRALEPGGGEEASGFGLRATDQAGTTPTLKPEGSPSPAAANADPQPEAAVQLVGRQRE